MLALAIALIIIALFSPVSAPTFVIWLIGIGCAGLLDGQERSRTG